MTEQEHGKTDKGKRTETSTKPLNGNERKRKRKRASKHNKGARRMNTYMKPVQITDASDVFDILNDIKDDSRSLFMLTSGIYEPEDPDTWPYSLISDIAFSIAETLENVVYIIEHGEAGER